MRNEDDLLERWCDENGWSFEGDSGLARLEDLCRVIGYRGHGFKYGDPIQAFLSDNPGACAALVEFIGERLEKTPEWRESLEEELGEEESDEGGEEEEENHG